MPKLRIGVLMGGKSIEHEVSFNSGRTVCDHLDTTQYEIIPLFQKRNGLLYILPWHFLHRGKTTDFSGRLEQEAQHISWDALKDLIDFMYLAVHGRYAEDGTLQGFLEVLGIPYLGSKVLASALSMDKTVQKKILQVNNVDVPKGITVTPNQIEYFSHHADSIFQQLEQAHIKLPYVIKPNQEGSSLGITVIFNNEDLEKALLKACNTHQGTKQPVLIEEKLEGMEFSCITITDYKTGTLIPLPPTEIVPESQTDFFDYEQKYMPGRAEKFTPPRCSEEIIKKIHDACKKTTTTLGITNISRIDGFVTKDNHVVIVDPNTLSGMGPSSFLFREAAEINMSHTDLINHLIKTELHELGSCTELCKKTNQKEKTMNKKIRVAVLMGGQSHEKEISLESGRNIAYKLSPHKYELIPLFVSSNMELFEVNQSLLVRNSTKEIEAHLDPKTKRAWNDLPKIADFVFIGLHGGAGENGAVQGTLEMLELPYNGSSVLTSALCMDKYKTNQFLQKNGFSIPQALLIKKDEWNDNKKELEKKILETIPLPCIVKPHDDGCSVMVQKIKNKENLSSGIDLLFDSGKEYALIEECITGMELTVGVIGNDTPQALPPSQAVATSDILSIEEKFLPGAGENQTPAPLAQKTLQYIQKTMEDVYSMLNCKGYARIDCFYQTKDESPTKQERVIIIEINSLPGMTPATCIFHQAAELGIKPMDFIDKIITLGFEHHKKSTAEQKQIIPEKRSKKHVEKNR